ncbi:PREDICTED: protein FAM13A-like [Gekko japonicus]|uniref:Protein FAM13A-like n=1 Tax=Gekko japonicus TaxID=146911 RepID=A0ABM1KIC9_GEKJA|nr:PREDICTED: protein FAM13A-like [Gekko japonicus]
MQPPVVAVTDCSLFLCSFKQSKSAVRLKEDVKKLAAAAAAAPPLSRRRATSWRRVFGVGLAELQQQGLSRDGVPTLVWEIVEYLTRHGLASEGLFRVNGNLKTVEHLRAKYENGEAVELPAEGDVSSAASLLKLFLRELPDGVITSALHPKFIQLYQDKQNAGQNTSALRELLSQLPEAHYSLLKYLCQFLRRVAEHHTENRMTVSNLATVFGPNCFHVSSGFDGMKEQEICNKIMAQMLEDYTTLFEWQLTKEETEKHPCEELAKIILVKFCRACCKGWNLKYVDYSAAQDFRQIAFTPIIKNEMSASIELDMSDGEGNTIPDGTEPDKEETPPETSASVPVTTTPPVYMPVGGAIPKKSTATLFLTPKDLAYPPRHEGRTSWNQVDAEAVRESYSHLGESLRDSLHDRAGDGSPGSPSRAVPTLVGDQPVKDQKRPGVPRGGDIGTTRDD